MAFDVKKHLIKVQGGRQYLPVSARLVWFCEEHPSWGIETESVIVDTEREYAVFRATVRDETGRLISMGTKMEDKRGFPDYVEKAETGAIGRALAVCGFGTQFCPDIDEMDGNRLVDSSQRGYDDRGPSRSNGNGNGYRSSNNGGSQPADPKCAGCGAGLTRGQVDISVHRFGSPLCPNCQKNRPAEGAQQAAPLQPQAAASTAPAPASERHWCVDCTAAKEETEISGDVARQTKVRHGRPLCARHALAADQAMAGKAQAGK